MSNNGIFDEEVYSVCITCLTYNHSKYITDALDGFVMQHTDFPFLILLIDDASTDGEQDILRDYISAHFNLLDNIPNVVNTEEAAIQYAKHKINKQCDIILYYLKTNHYQRNKDKTPFLLKWWEKSKYIALCEGDDYWVDPYKLAKQVQSFKDNNDVTLVYTAFNTIDDNGKVIERDYYNKAMLRSHSGGILTDLLDANFILTLTSCFRADIVINIAKSRSGKAYDYMYFLEAASLGSSVYLSDITGCYRLNPQSLMNTRKSEIDMVLWDIYKQYALKFLRKEIGANYSVIERLKTIGQMYFRALKKALKFEDCSFILELFKASIL